MATAATKTEQSNPWAKAKDDTIPLVNPKRVVVNKAGQVRRDVMVRMPEKAVSDDLRNPRIWKLVQQIPQVALIQYDQLFILAHDESWGAEAIVKKATNQEASLVVLKVFGFAEAGEGLYSDGRNEVYFNGVDFNARRVTDKVPVFPSGYSSEGMVIDALRKLYQDEG